MKSQVFQLEVLVNNEWTPVVKYKKQGWKSIILHVSTCITSHHFNLYNLLLKLNSVSLIFFLSTPLLADLIVFVRKDESWNSWKSPLMRGRSSSCHSTLACVETIKYSYNSNSKPHKWSGILASLPQRENKALCPVTNRWRFHGSCRLQANSFPFLCPHSLKKGEKSSTPACITPPRINMET